MDAPLDAFIVLIVALLVLVAFDVLAIRLGVDSRDGIGDDHQRGTNG